MKEYAVMPLPDYKGICDSIRNKTKEEKEIKSGDIPNEINAVYEQGKQAEYDRFWDAYQENGNRTGYEAAFAGNGWTKETLRPKYDIVPSVSTHIFARGSFGGDLQEHLESIGKRLDFSNASTLVEIVYYTAVTRLGVIDTRSVLNLTTSFAYAREALQTIDLLILRDDGSQTFGNNSFIQCTGLTNLTIQGVIGKNGLNLQWSTKLSKASIISVINCLSTTTSGLSVTLSSTAVNNAFTAEEWTALEQTRPNWTISLV